jgi:hypothetical protein
VSTLAATMPGTTWASLRKAFTRHGLGMPARNSEAAASGATVAAHQRCRQSATPSLSGVLGGQTGASQLEKCSRPRSTNGSPRGTVPILGVNVVVVLNSVATLFFESLD